MLIRLIILVALLLGAYFGYVRDRFIEYPIEMKLSSKNGASIQTRVQWRDSDSLQFEKVGSSILYSYKIEKLDWLSQAKLFFLPISSGPKEDLFNNEDIDLQVVHAAGLDSEIDRLGKQLSRLKGRVGLRLPEAEQNTVKREIENLEIKIKELVHRRSLIDD
jgi:hypothetical protein